MKGRQSIRLFTRTFTTGEFSKFPGAKAPFTTELEIRKNFKQTPVFRVLNTLGEPIRSDYKLPFQEEKLIFMYRTMVQLSEMDKRFYDAQRQGRISFYMTNFGEEGTHIGSAAALDPSDVVFGQYREAGVLMYRGFTLDQFANQCFSNVLDLGKGRQMPVHYGSRALNFQTISSPLSTQIPQASGAAYAIKLDNKKLVNGQKGTKMTEAGGRCVICYFGDGAASEGDFHVALNFAATLDCPVIFFCRNNGFAISTPTTEQYRGDGIVSRGEGYGMASVRVDGNDLLAVYHATLAARELCVNESRPVLIEAMTYRGGHHSTSDDSSRYRSQTEINSWAENDNPVIRCRLYLEKLGLWDADKEVLLRHEMRKNVMDSMLKAERTRRPPVSHLFTDVFHDVPPHLREQQAELLSHLSRYESNYASVLDEFEKDSDYVDPSKE